MLELKAGPMRAHDYTTLFKLEHMLKDVRLCLEEALAAGVPVPGGRRSARELLGGGRRAAATATRLRGAARGPRGLRRHAALSAADSRWSLADLQRESRGFAGGFWDCSGCA